MFLVCVYSDNIQYQVMRTTTSVIITLLAVGTVMQHDEVYITIIDQLISFERYRMLVDYMISNDYFISVSRKNIYIFYPKYCCAVSYLSWGCTMYTYISLTITAALSIFLTMLFSMSRMRCIRLGTEAFFSMRKCHVYVGIHTFKDAFISISTPYFRNVNFVSHRMPYYARNIYKKRVLVQTI